MVVFFVFTVNQQEKGMPVSLNAQPVYFLFGFTILAIPLILFLINGHILHPSDYLLRGLQFFLAYFFLDPIIIYLKSVFFLLKKRLPCHQKCVRLWHAFGRCTSVHRDGLWGEKPITLQWCYTHLQKKVCHPFQGPLIDGLMF